MKVFFVNPPFKGGYGKFSRESRSPSIGHSGVLYYPLWLIYAAAVCEKDGFQIEFLDAPAKRMSEDEKEQYAVNRQQLTSLLNYRSSLLNEAIDVMSSSDGPLTKIEGFSF